MSDTESLLIPAENNAVRTNYINASIDKTHQNCRCRLYGNRDETTNYIISKWNKIALKENKTKHDWVDKVIYWKQCKKFKFDYTNR